MTKKEILREFMNVLVIAIIAILFIVSIHQVISNLLPAILSGNSGMINYKDTIAVFVVYSVIMLNRVNKNERK